MFFNKRFLAMFYFLPAWHIKNYHGVVLLLKQNTYLSKTQQKTKNNGQ